MTTQPSANKKSQPKQLKQPVKRGKKLPNIGPAAHTETPEKDNKYEQKDKVGTPTLGRSKNYVSKVGLGNLRTITYGNTDVQP